MPAASPESTTSDTTAGSTASNRTAAETVVSTGTLVISEPPPGRGTAISRQEIERLRRLLSKCKPPPRWDAAGLAILAAGVTALATAATLPTNSSGQVEIIWWAVAIAALAIGAVLTIVAYFLGEDASDAVQDVGVELDALDARIGRGP